MMDWLQRLLGQDDSRFTPGAANRGAQEIWRLICAQALDAAIAQIALQGEVGAPALTILREMRRDVDRLQWEQWNERWVR